MAFWTSSVVAVLRSWWLAGAVMPFAGAVVACPSLGTLGRYCPASLQVAALLSLPHSQVRFRISSAWSISRFRLVVRSAVLAD